MYKYISKETQSSLLKLGVYQILGGAIGLLLAIWFLINTSVFNGLLVLLLLFMVSFFVYSVYCGWLCVQANEHCLKHSLINQFLQVVGFAAFGCAFQYAAGVYIGVGLDLSQDFKLNFGMGVSKVDFKFNLDPEAFKVGVNLVALALIIWIDKTMRRMRLEKQFRQIAELGQELQEQ